MLAMSPLAVYISHLWGGAWLFTGPGDQYQADVIGFTTNGRVASTESHKVGRKRLKVNIPTAPALTTLAQLSDGSVMHVLTTARDKNEAVALYRRRLTGLESAMLGAQKLGKKVSEDL